MSPSEDAALLLVTVRRHLCSLALTIDPAFPQEDWGFLGEGKPWRIVSTGAVDTPLLGDRLSLLGEIEALIALHAPARLSTPSICYRFDAQPMPALSLRGLPQEQARLLIERTRGWRERMRDRPMLRVTSKVLCWMRRRC